MPSMAQIQFYAFNTEKTSFLLDLNSIKPSSLMSSTARPKPSFRPTHAMEVHMSEISATQVYATYSSGTRRKIDNPRHLIRTPVTSNSLRQGRPNNQVETTLRPSWLLGGRLWDLTSTIKYELSSPSEKVMTELGHIIIIAINLENGHLIEDTDRGLVGDKWCKCLHYPSKAFYTISSPRLPL